MEMAAISLPPLLLTAFCFRTELFMDLHISNLFLLLFVFNYTSFKKKKKTGTMFSPDELRWQPFGLRIARQDTS